MILIAEEIKYYYFDKIKPSYVHYAKSEDLNRVQISLYKVVKTSVKCNLNKIKQYKTHENE